MEFLDYKASPSAIDTVSEDRGSHVEGGSVDTQATAARDNLFGQVYVRKQKVAVEDVEDVDRTNPSPILGDLLQDGAEPPNKKFYELKIDLLDDLGWAHIASYERRWMFVRMLEPIFYTNMSVWDNKKQVESFSIRPDFVRLDETGELRYRGKIGDRSENANEVKKITNKGERLLADLFETKIDNGLYKKEELTRNHVYNRSVRPAIFPKFDDLTIADSAAESYGRQKVVAAAFGSAEEGLRRRSGKPSRPLPFLPRPFPPSSSFFSSSLLRSLPLLRQHPLPHDFSLSLSARAPSSSHPYTGHVPSTLSDQI
ncbi:Tripeptidyl-peptidase 2 [Nymphaea thermarum]|nr:Tripeptidyl-peptidase 2 [Nymphaea thermarum]